MTRSTRNQVRVLIVLALTGLAPIAAAPHVQADKGFEFSLDEVEAANGPKDKPEKGKPEKGKAKAAKTAPIAEALGELRWGMSKGELLGVLKKRIRTDYTARIKAQPDIVLQDALYSEANETFRRLKDGYVEFDGRKTGWDASAIAEEFTHGSNESMLVVDDPSARDLYFFFHGRLWKWYRELKPAAFGGANFDGIAELLQDQFGKARERAEPRSEHGAAYRMLTWSDAKTRVSALWRGAETCLVFEDNETLERLAMLREHAQPRGGKRGAVLQGVIMTTAQREAWRERQ
jgi:hypothetical protein